MCSFIDIPAELVCLQGQSDDNNSTHCPSPPHTPRWTPRRTLACRPSSRWSTSCRMPSRSWASPCASISRRLPSSEDSPPASRPSWRTSSAGECRFSSLHSPYALISPLQSSLLAHTRHIPLAMQGLPPPRLRHCHASPPRPAVDQRPLQRVWRVPAQEGHEVHRFRPDQGGD